ncbi:MAG: transcription termination/antitermination protein NusA [Lachnospiraceae bacterium]|nr:transcription termination/antitermination protein NusA [Lachnospiraceae bacterium]
MRKKKVDDSPEKVREDFKLALEALEREKDISRDTIYEALENALLTAGKNHFGRADNMHCEINRDTMAFYLYVDKEVVENVEDPVVQIGLEEAREKEPLANIGDTVRIELPSRGFSRIAIQNAKNVILQKIREEERNAVFNDFVGREHNVVTGTVQRFIGRNISLNLGKTDGFLSENEQVKNELLQLQDRVKVYILEVRNTNKGPKILVSRTHPELVRRLFENEVAEVEDGTVEIRGISREPGSRTKIAVWSNNPDVDAVGACVGMNGTRVNAVVDELGGEKIDIVNWDENPAIFIENALSPSKVVSVIVDGDEKTAKVVVPNHQLSLAIGKEGQNARLAARLTGYKIDIKSEDQAKDAPGFRMEDYLDYDDEYDDEEYEGEGYEEDYEGGYAEEYVEEDGEEAAPEESGNAEDTETEDIETEDTESEDTETEDAETEDTESEDTETEGAETEDTEGEDTETEDSEPEDAGAGDSTPKPDDGE